MKYKNIREEELKNKVGDDFFKKYDCSRIIGNVDFCVSAKLKGKEFFEQSSFFWAEAKRNSSNIYHSIVQLILTIGKARTFDKFLPPPFLGAFDGEKIAFIPYSDVHDIFYTTDFNWNVTPSDNETREFNLVLDKVKSIIESSALLFNFENDEKEIHNFIKAAFIEGNLGLTRTKIDKNNFMVIYNKWLLEVKPTIAVKWDIAMKSGIIDGDFYLADLLSRDNHSLKEKLFVLLNQDHYILDKKVDDTGMFSSKRTDFNDGQAAHTQFWNRYERPPKEEYWDYIVERRDLLVPQDIRERKGSFFTPQIWVELSQKYIADVLGEDWQDEYYVWDCAAGTGNLLTGLTNKYNIWASTLDRQDVEVIHDRIKNGANLLEDHVFQFDFLNDDFAKLPKPLQDIINDPEKRKKLVVYINPPYAESNGRVTVKRKDVQTTKVHSKYATNLEKVSPELFAQFLARIYFEIPDCIIAQFSKFKIISSSNSQTFRNFFLAKAKKCFVVPGNTFDNVKGQFPIGFFIWDTKEKIRFEKIGASIYDVNGKYLGIKDFHTYDNEKGTINSWLKTYKTKDGKNNLGYLMADSPDFQNNNFIALINEKAKRHGINFQIVVNNLLISCVYLTVRHAIEATWLNDRDQFLFPNTCWENDNEFQNDCLTIALFHSQNRINSKYGTNHWIPFTEQEVDSREKFESNFMTDFINGKLQYEETNTLFTEEEQRTKPLEFSEEAKEVFNAGRELWKYYHKQPGCNVNASLYDIREHFQGRNEKGKMNNKSDDETYTELISNLRNKLKILQAKIVPKIYEYEFLKK